MTRNPQNLENLYQSSQPSRISPSASIQGDSLSNSICSSHLEDVLIGRTENGSSVLAAGALSGLPARGCSKDHGLLV